MRHWILFISLFTLLPSCRKGEAPSPGVSDEPIENPIPLRFSAGVSTSVSSEESGRAPITGTHLPISSEVGVYGILADVSRPDEYTFRQVMSGDTYFQDYLENAHYVVSTAEGAMDQEFIAQYPTNDSGYNGLTLYAYHPYTASVVKDNFNKDYLIATTLESEYMERTPDYLYTKQVVAPTPNQDGAVVKLTFEHALARLRFVFKSTNPEAAVKVGQIVVDANCSKKGTMSIQTGEAVPERKTGTLYTYNLNQYITPEGLVAEYLLYPESTINTIQCQIQVGEGTMSVYDINPSGIKLERGKYMTVNVTFSPKTATISNDITGWESQGEADVSIDEKTEG